MRKRVEQMLQSWEEADQALLRIGRLERRLKSLEILQAEGIERIKREVKGKAEPVVEQKKALELQLEQFCVSRKAEFKDVRSKRLTFGTVGFRVSTRILFKRAAEVVALCREFALEHCIRIKEEPDKPRLAELPDEDLRALGCTRKTVDAFGYEIDEERIREVDAA